MRLGSIATGDDFFGRETERADLWHYLEKDHINATGPRRLGKSSILNRLREEAKAKGVLAEYVDVEGIDNAPAFIALLEQAFPASGIKNYLSGIEQQGKQWLAAIKKVEVKGPAGMGAALELQALASQPWSQSATNLAERLSDAPILIFIDEFSVFLQKLLARDVKEGEALLAWLRAWRIRPGLACRFLFTGSIGLNALLASHRMTAQFNDCHEYPIGPFKPAAARSMLETLASRSEWLMTEAVIDHLCQRVGWLSPFFLCLLFDQTRLAGRDRLEETRSSTASILNELLAQDVDAGYERLLSSRSRFAHWEERLSRDLAPADLAFVRQILSALAKINGGLTIKQLSARLSKLEPDQDQRATRLQFMLAKLQEEGYLSPPDAHGRIQFLSFLLRDYWGRNHG